MRISQNGIIGDILEHIRQCGGDFAEWSVGTAKEPQGPLFQQPAAESSGLIYRGAYTPYAAEGAIEYLKGLGLHPDPDSAPGRVVFAYRVVQTTPRKEEAVFAKT